MPSPLDQWCKDKHPLVAGLAKELAWSVFHFVSGAFEVSAGNRDHLFDNSYSPAEWLNLYHDPERLPKWLFDTGGGPGTWKKFKEFLSRPTDTVDEMMMAVDELESGFSSQPAESENSNGELELEFFGRVLIPSILVYRQFPWGLYEAATKHEDYLALEQLIRIDRLLIFDPKIQRLWIDAFRGQNEALRKLFLRALKKTPKFTESELKPRKAKVLYASFVKVCAKQVGDKSVTVSNLMDLVYAAAKEFSGSNHEIDFYVDEDAFRKALDRGEEDLEKLFNISQGAN